MCGPKFVCSARCTESPISKASNARHPRKSEEVKADEGATSDKNGPSISLPEKCGRAWWWHVVQMPWRYKS